MNRTDFRRGYNLLSSSFPPRRHFSRSPCHDRRLTESRSSSVSSSDSYTSKRYKRFDKFKNESRRHLDINYEINKESLERSSKYQEERNRQRSNIERLHSSDHRDGRKQSSDVTMQSIDGTSSKKFQGRDTTKKARPYDSYEYDSDLSEARNYSTEKTAKVPSPPSYYAIVSEDTRCSSTEPDNNQDKSTSGDDNRYNGRVTRSRSRSTSRSSNDSSSAQKPKRLDKFSSESPRFDIRREDRNVMKSKTCSRYTTDKNMKSQCSPYKFCDRVKRSGFTLNSSRMVEHFSGSSQYGEFIGQEISSRYLESRRKESMSRESSKRDPTKRSRCYDFKDDRSDYTKSRSQDQRNDLKLKISNHATPAILNINFNSAVTCGTHERKFAADSHTSPPLDHRLHANRTSHRYSGKINDDCTDQLSRDPEVSHSSRSHVNNCSYRDKRPMIKVKDQRQCDEREKITRHI